MFTLKPDQLLSRIRSEEGFVDWYVHHFMPDHLPTFHMALPAPALAERVRAGWHKAQHHRFTQPRAIFHFVTLMWLVGPGFDRCDGFWQVLARTDLDPGGRIDALYGVDRELAALAIVHADDSAWWRIDP